MFNKNKNLKFAACKVVVSNNQVLNNRQELLIISLKASFIRDNYLKKRSYGML